MSSLSTKANKSRSSTSQKIRSKKGTKSAAKKPARPGKITAAPKKTSASKTKKQTVAAGRSQVAKKSASSAPAKAVKKSARPVASKKRVASRKIKAVTKSAPLEKRGPSANAFAAVKAFEQALKLFNRHNFDAAKTAFLELNSKFSEQTEIVARARTYLTICGQRLSRTPAAPRNPDALYDQGVFEFNRGNFKESIDLFSRALKSEPRSDHVLYSLAAAYARLNEPQRSLDSLRRAISIRNVHRSHARNDADFASLHTNEEFQQLTGFGFDFAEE
jgi:tetratricopeptide (TPR) repeat protein